MTISARNSPCLTSFSERSRRNYITQNSIEDLSPALQATGWSFLQLIYRSWVAFVAPLLTWWIRRIAISEAAARHLAKADMRAWNIGWGSWMDFVVWGKVLFVISLFALRVFWKPATIAQEAGQSAATGAAVSRPGTS